MQLPSWCEESERERLAFLFRLAALYHNKTGSLRDLATAINRSNSFFTVVCQRGSISMEDAVAIERLVGRSLFPRELLRPDLALDAA